MKPIIQKQARSAARRALFVVGVCLACAHGGWAGDELIVRAIHVRNLGPGPVAEDLVLAQIELEEGQPLARSVTSEDVRALQRTGKFSHVTVDIESTPGGVIVTYVLRRKPIMRAIEVVGADYLGNRKVWELMELKAGEPVDDQTLAVRSQAVTQKYREKYFPDARLDWTLVTDDTTGYADVNIRVEEGRRAPVTDILFTGNDHVRASDLRAVMQQKRTTWLSWITGSGAYDPVDAEGDRESIRRALMGKGYLNASVGSPDVRMDRKGRLTLTYPIEEGPLYRVGDISLEGVSRFSTAEVMRALNVVPGGVASYSLIASNAVRVEDYYGTRGLLNTGVDIVLDTPTTGAVADVVYRVTEGTPASVRGVLIRGNSVTKDKVIRRELNVYPGQPYNNVRVRTSTERVRNLGFFSYVNNSMRSTAEPGVYDLVLDVEEQPTGQFTVGAGFSSIDNLVGFAELSQGNFNLFGPPFVGGGQKVRLRVQAGAERNDYELSFLEPWFLNRRLSLGFDLFRRDSRYFSDDYDQRNTGGSLTLGRAINSYNRVNLTYGLEKVEVFNVSTNASEQIRQEEGSRVVSSLTPEWVFDSRNRVFVPTRGNRTSAAVTLAGGPLGADTDLYKLQVRSSQYFPLWFDTVFNLRGYAAVVEPYGSTDRVPIFDRLFLGGGRSIRAFAYREVGPKDEDGEPIGGQTAAYGTAEYSIPVVELVRFAVFYDIGMVWADAYDFDFGNLNSGWGVGIRLDFRGFPIQLDYAWPVQADAYNDRPSGRFSFWIGYAY